MRRFVLALVLLFAAEASAQTATPTRTPTATPTRTPTATPLGWVKHLKTNTVADCTVGRRVSNPAVTCTSGPDCCTAAMVKPSDWNASHIVTGGSNGDEFCRDSAQPAGWKWCTPVVPSTPVATVTPGPTSTPLVFGTPGKIPVFNAPELGTFGGNACPTPAFATSIDGFGALTCATPLPVSSAPTPTPLAFGTPGVIAIFASPELGEYGGATCPTPGFVTAISTAGATTCATPVPPTPRATDTPAPTATPGTGGGGGAAIGWRSAAACDNATPAPLWDLATSLQPTPNCASAPTNNFRAWLTWPDADGNYHAQLHEMLSATPASLTADIWWFSPTATTGDVVFQLALVCTGDGETDDQAYGTAATVTDTAKGTVNQLNKATITAMSTSGCSAGEIMNLDLMRQRTHGSDTIAGVVDVVGVYFTVN